MKTQRRKRPAVVEKVVAVAPPMIFSSDLLTPEEEREVLRRNLKLGVRREGQGAVARTEFDVLEHAPVGGYYTPSMLTGAGCVEQLPGSTPIRVD